MLDPSELLAVARLLASDETPPTDARFRRAVSTAYYALFHTVSRAAAQRFVGPDHHGAPAFSLLYRGLDHQQVRRVCEDLQVPTLKDKYKRRLGRSSVSQELRNFAGLLPGVQDARYAADYDPAAIWLRSDVDLILDSAESAIDAFARLAPDERTDVLALMLIGTRTT